MRLAIWRRDKGMTQEELARLLDCTQPYISSLERSQDPAVPARDLMVRIYRVTNGDVAPNDFYDLPDLEAGLPLEDTAPAPAPLFDGAIDALQDVAA